jgi:hypothetical protein
MGYFERRDCLKLLCECGNEILKTDKFNLKYFELDEFPSCQKCGRQWYVYVMAREERHEKKGE